MAGVSAPDAALIKGERFFPFIVSAYDVLRGVSPAEHFWDALVQEDSKGMSQAAKKAHAEPHK